VWKWTAEEEIIAEFTEQLLKNLLDIASSKEVWSRSFRSGCLWAKGFYNGLPANYGERSQRNIISCTARWVTKRFISLEDLTEFFT